MFSPVIYIHTRTCDCIIIFVCINMCIHVNMYTHMHMYGNFLHMNANVPNIWQVYWNILEYDENLLNILLVCPGNHCPSYMWYKLSILMIIDICQLKRPQVPKGPGFPGLVKVSANWNLVPIHSNLCSFIDVPWRT